LAVEVEDVVLLLQDPAALPRRFFPFVPAPGQAQGDFLHPGSLVLVEAPLLRVAREDEAPREPVVVRLVLPQHQDQVLVVQGYLRLQADEAGEIE
jgi:hypothetical protein